MRKLWWTVTVVLLAGAISLGVKLRKDWRAYRGQADPQAIKVRPLPDPPPLRAVPPRDYSAIRLQNPFHPERNDNIVVSEAKALGPPPLVYGSVILGQERFALLATEENPKPQRVAEGQSFNGYKVAQVLPQSVVFETATGKSELMLYNQVARLHRDHVKTPSSSASPASSQPAAVQATADQPSSAVPVSSASSPATPPQAQIPPGPAQPGKHVMQTPFGPIWIEDRR